MTHKLYYQIRFILRVYTILVACHFRLYSTISQFFMYLIEKHIINSSHSFYKECDELCFKSKNIYNQALYNVRKYYFDNKKYLNYYSNYHITKEQECYNYLPSNVFCQTVRLVDRNFKSFFSLIKNPSIKNKIPKYLDIKNGRCVTIYPKKTLSKKIFFKTGKIYLSQSNIYITTRIKDFNQIKEVRIVPRVNHYVIEVVYKKEEKQHNETGIIASIDLGLNNLATVTFNNGKNPIIINGRPIKSINQYFNKKKSHLQSKLKNNQKSSNKIKKLTQKRNNKVNDYIHKASRLLVNQLVSNSVSTLVIGKNTSMKQDINIGKKNNQNFTQLPIFKFADVIKYKCELEGINIIFQEESYTSKCSFFDNEEICKKENYYGIRIKRGLFKTKSNKIINADVNGSYNIMKKAIPNGCFPNGIEGLGINPVLLNIKR